MTATALFGRTGKLRLLKWFTLGLKTMQMKLFLETPNAFAGFAVQESIQNIRIVDKKPSRSRKNKTKDNWVWSSSWHMEFCLEISA